MKITCQQKDLLRGLTTVLRAVDKRAPMPILQNIFLGTEHGSLKLVATNLEITICCWVDARIEKDGSITLPARLLTDFVESLPNGPVDLALLESTQRVQIDGLRSRAHIQGTEPSEFPLLPIIESDVSPILFDTSVLKEIIQEVVIAASSSANHASLNSVYAELQGEQLTFVAADSFRLAMRINRLPGHQEKQESLLIPARTLHELAHILPEEGTVQMLTLANKAQVLFHTDSLDLTSRLLVDSYPNFRNAIPTSYTTRAVIDVKEFAAIVKSVLPFSTRDSPIAHVTIAPGIQDGLTPGSLTLEAETEGVGENISTIPAVVEGPGLHISLNAKYLSECLSVLRTPEVALELQSATKPAILRPINFTDYLYMVLPSSQSISRSSNHQPDR